MVVRGEGFEVGELLVDYSADYRSGEGDVGLPDGWYVSIEDVYTIVQSPHLIMGEEEVQLHNYNAETIEEEIIKHLKR